MVEDPGDYRWGGYAEAMARKPEAMAGIARITGATAEREYGQGLGEAAPVESPAMRQRRHLRALIHYRQMLGLAGRPRVREDGKTVRRGVSEKVQARLASESGVRREQVMKRVRHFTDGVILGSRAFIDEWFERNRGWFGGRSQKVRKTGSRPIRKGWQDLYNLRKLKPRGHSL